MFRKVPKEERNHKLETENKLLKAQLAKAESNVDYLSMMSGIDLPEEANNQGMDTETEGGEDNE